MKMQKQMSASNARYYVFFPLSLILSYKRKYELHLYLKQSTTEDAVNVPQLNLNLNPQHSFFQEIVSERERESELRTFKGS